MCGRFSIVNSTSKHFTFLPSPTPVGGGFSLRHNFKKNDTVSFYAEVAICSNCIKYFHTVYLLKNKGYADMQKNEVAIICIFLGGCKASETGKQSLL